MPLADVRHQGAALRRIQQALSRERVPHAYLFHGPEGVGKETVAKGLAQLLLCGNASERELSSVTADAVGLKRVREGCGQCVDCRLIAADTHPDFHVVYRQLHRYHSESKVQKQTGLELVVDVVREFLIDKAGLTPLRGRAKVFVIRNAEDMNENSQNALLKTLEEPPEDTFIILLASALDHLLPTTQSRCQIVRFGALPQSFVRDRLHEIRPALSVERCEWYARCGEGSLGRTLEYADDELFELNLRLAEGLERLGDSRNDGLFKTWTDDAAALGERYQKRDPEITDAEAKRRGLATVFRLAAGWFADVLRNRANTSRFVDAESAAEAIRRLAEAERQLGLNVNTQLIVETLAGDLAEAVAA